MHEQARLSCVLRGDLVTRCSGVNHGFAEGSIAQVIGGSGWSLGRRVRGQTTAWGRHGSGCARLRGRCGWASLRLVPGSMSSSASACKRCPIQRIFTLRTSVTPGSAASAASAVSTRSGSTPSIRRRKMARPRPGVDPHNPGGVPSRAVHESALKRLTPRRRRKADPIRGVPQFGRNSFPSCRRGWRGGQAPMPSRTPVRDYAGQRPAAH